MLGAHLRSRTSLSARRRAFLSTARLDKQRYARTPQTRSPSVRPVQEPVRVMMCPVQVLQMRPAQVLQMRPRQTSRGESVPVAGADVCDEAVACERVRAGQGWQGRERWHCAEPEPSRRREGSGEVRASAPEERVWVRSERRGSRARAPRSVSARRRKGGAARMERSALPGFGMWLSSVTVSHARRVRQCRRREGSVVSAAVGHHPSVGSAERSRAAGCGVGPERPSRALRGWLARTEWLGGPSTRWPSSQTSTTLYS